MEMSKTTMCNRKKRNNVNHVVRTFSKPFFEIIVKYLFVAVITSMNNPKSNISTFITSAVSLIILKSLSFSNTLENFMGLRLQNEIFGNSNSPYFCFIRVFVGSLQYKYMIQVSRIHQSICGFHTAYKKKKKKKKKSQPLKKKN